MPRVLTPAPRRASFDMTAFAIGALGATCTFGAPALIVWCIRLNGWA